jgi:predicted transcriptional regulator YheO
MQYSFLAALEKKKEEDENMSKFYQSRNDKSRMLKSHSILPEMGLRASNFH